MHSKHTLPSILRILHAIEDSILVLVLSIMILLSFTQIVLRNVWGTGLYWADPLLRHMVLWIGLLGAMVATRNDNHISVDVISYFLPLRAKAGVRVLSDAFTAAVCILLTYASIKLLRNEMEGGMTVFGSVPVWVAEMILPVSFGVIGLRYLLYLSIHLQEAATGTKTHLDRTSDSTSDDAPQNSLDKHSS